MNSASNRFLSAYGRRWNARCFRIFQALRIRLEMAEKTMHSSLNAPKSTHATPNRISFQNSTIAMKMAPTRNQVHTTPEILEIAFGAIVSHSAKVILLPSFCCL